MHRLLSVIDGRPARILYPQSLEGGHCTSPGPCWRSHMGESNVAVDRPEPERPEGAVGEPEGSPYEWFRRAMGFIATGNPEAAIVLLERLLITDPDSLSVLEAHARALFDARRYEAAVRAFESVLERAPDDDYAHFGLGMSLWREQHFQRARDELAMAFVMRPHRAEYGEALAQVKATLRARALSKLPPDGPVAGIGAIG
jgi:tetratricopeptide (TPR) repeat protein